LFGLIFVKSKNIHFQSIFEAFVNSNRKALLDLSYNQRLRGNLPSEIEHLTKLEQMYLTMTGLSGSLPSKIGMLPLVQLFMIQTNFEGTLPDSFYELSRLEDVIVSSNNFTGKIRNQMGQLSNLRNVYLSSNKFTGTIPDWIGDLTDLKAFHIQENLFTGSIPDSVCKSRATLNFELVADCFGDIYEEEIECECCTQCCEQNPPHIECTNER